MSDPAPVCARSDARVNLTLDLYDSAGDDWRMEGVSLELAYVPETSTNDKVGGRVGG